MKNKKVENPLVEKYLTPNVQLEFIIEDFVLPPKALLIGRCQKKNKRFGFETRHLMLGYSQLIIARDESFEAILAVIPLEGGFCMVKKPRDQDVLILESTHRQYVLKFEALGECLKWYRVIQKVTCRELKVKKYLKRL